MNLTAPEKNALESLFMLLQLTKVRVTRSTVREKLWQHPDFPSLASLSDVLDELKVSNMATLLTYEQLPTIPLPAIAYLEIDGGIFVLIRTISADIVEWLHTKRGWQKQSLSDFSQIWNGVTLLVEANQQSGEADYTKQRKKQWIKNSRYPLIIIGVLMCLGLILTYSQQVKPNLYGQQYGLLGIKLAGIIVSCLLIAYSLNNDNSFLRSICQLNSRTNCNSILKSEAANVFEWLSWSEVGLFYFAGGFITLCLNHITADEGLISPLWGFAGLSLIYVVYSVYYQAFIAKKWCILCLIIQALLMSEVIIGLSTSVPLAFPESIITWMLFGIAFLLIPIVWMILKPIFIKASQTNLLIRTIQRMKFTPSYLQAITSQHRTLPPIFNGMKVIEVGNSNAENTLILVTTPTCSACRRNHKLLKKLLENRNDLQGKIIFAASINNQTDEAGQVARIILNQPISDMSEALNLWFDRENNSYSDWINSLPSFQNSNSITNEQLELHLRWCELAGVTNTPAIFLNSIELPTEYSIPEVGRLITSFSLHGFDQIT